uniref:ShKT domain-containing protein n=1 Tax=Romanomermis culicivorax TaxID=13658 RepID=A0A915L167_ROMCU
MQRRLVSAIISVLFSYVGCQSSIGPNDCQDNHPLCKFWGSIGECNNNPSYMSLACPDTCFTCDALLANQPIDTNSNDSTLNGQCRDQFDLCDFWAKADQCYEKEEFMAQNCKASCGSCDGNCVACPPGVDVLPVFQERPVQRPVRSIHEVVEQRYVVEERRRGLLHRVRRSGCRARPSNPGCENIAKSQDCLGGCPIRPSISLVPPPKLHFAPKCCIVAAKSGEGRFHKKFAPTITLTLSNIKKVQSAPSASGAGSPSSGSPAATSAAPPPAGKRRKSRRLA